jgi:hypothetical protein
VPVSPHGSVVTLFLRRRARFQLLHVKYITSNFVHPVMSIQMHFLFSLGLTSMSDASSFRDAVLAKIVLAQY